MKQSIITPQQVVEIAFSDGGYLSPDVVAQVDIEAAAERWVKPVVGEALLEAVAAGRYEELREEYLKPVLALYTRLLVQPRLNVATSQLGLTVSAGATCKAAEASHRSELMQALKARARTALRALSHYLDDHTELLAEYEPKRNVLNRCSCDGGFVQIF